MDENLHKNVAEQKAKRDKREAKKKAGLTHNNRNALPVMSRREQTERMHELKARFLKSDKLEPFVKKLFDIAMDDDHPGQMPAMKMIADRVLPAQSFTSESKKSSAVQINISGLQVNTIEEKDISKEEVVSIQ